MQDKTLQLVYFSSAPHRAKLLTLKYVLKLEIFRKVLFSMSRKTNSDSIFWPVGLPSSHFESLNGRKWTWKNFDKQKIDDFDPKE